MAKQTFATIFSGALTVTPAAGNVFPSVHSGSLTNTPLTGSSVYQSTASGSLTRAWSPANDTANQVMWCDGNTVTPAGGPVSSWDDLSGHAHPPVQAVAGLRPTIAVGDANGVNALVFTGAGVGGQHVAATFARAQPWCEIAAIKETAPAVVGVTDCFADGSGAVGGLILDGGAINGLQVTAGTALSTGSVVVPGSYKIITVIWDGATTKVRRNSVQIGTGNAGANPGNGVTIGGLAGGLRGVPMTAAGWVLFPAIPSNDTLAVYENYMQVRYGA